MSPELETLDQLRGGDLSLTIVRTLYPSDEAFQKGIAGLLSSGDVSLIDNDRTEVPAWAWLRLLADLPAREAKDLKLRITPQGTQKIR